MKRRGAIKSRPSKRFLRVAEFGAAARAAWPSSPFRLRPIALSIGPLARISWQGGCAARPIIFGCTFLTRRSRTRSSSLSAIRRARSRRPAHEAKEAPLEARAPVAAEFGKPLSSKDAARVTKLLGPAAARVVSLSSRPFLQCSAPGGGRGAERSEALPPMDRKDFARFKWLWLKQVHDDLGLPRVAYQIAFHLADHLSWEKLEAWPSIETLAKKCGVTSRHVRDCLPSLEKKGHIRIRRGGAGPKSPNYYSLTPKSRPELAPETKSDDSGKGGTTVHPYEDRSMPLRVNCGSAKGEPQFQKGGTTVHPNNKKNNYRNLSAHAREAEANDDRPGGSTGFWALR